MGDNTGVETSGPTNRRLGPKRGRSTQSVSFIEVETLGVKEVDVLPDGVSTPLSHSLYVVREKMRFSRSFRFSKPVPSPLPVTILERTNRLV